MCGRLLLRESLESPHLTNNTSIRLITVVGRDLTYLMEYGEIEVVV